MRVLVQEESFSMVITSKTSFCRKFHFFSLLVKLIAPMHLMHSGYADMPNEFFL
jgi:hypothetical protein